MNLKLRKIFKNTLRAMKDPALLWRYIKYITEPEVHCTDSWHYCYGNIHRFPITNIFPGIEKVNVTMYRTFDRVEGTSLDTQEIVVLCAIVKFTKAKNILEIGTYDGNTALNLAANSPADALITTVDL